MEAEDWIHEAEQGPVQAEELLGLTVSVPSKEELDAARQAMSSHDIFQPSVHHFSGESAMDQAALYLRGNDGNARTQNADTIRSCRADAKCTSIWTTSPMLMGADIIITSVIGHSNATSPGANRCHGNSLETDIWCHKADSSLKASRGRMFLLEGVPTNDQDSSALPVAAMCHQSTEFLKKAGFKVDAWCHLISGNEFLVVPADFVADGAELATKSLRTIVMSGKDRAMQTKLSTGETVEV